MEFKAENEGIAIPTQMRWLANPLTIRERRQNEEIAASSVVLVVKGRKAALKSIKKGFKAAGVWYRVEGFTHAGPGSRCEHCCGWDSLKASAAASPSVATAQAITGQATTNAI